MARFSSNSTYKFANDTTIVGQISNNDETEYRNKIDSLVAWCKDNNLSLNVSKMKKLVIEFRYRSGGHVPVCINGPEVEVVRSFKFLGVYITNDLSSSTRINATIRLLQSALCQNQHWSVRQTDLVLEVEKGGEGPESEVTLT
eukprot:g34340.t1